MRLGTAGIFAAAIMLLLQQGCKTNSARSLPDPLVYKSFKDSLLRAMPDTMADAANLLDEGRFDPRKDSLNTLLLQLDTLWRSESADTVPHSPTMAKMAGKDSALQNNKALLNNLAALDSFFMNHNPAEKDTCRGINCMLFAAVSKSTQRLYLYVGGALADSFAVSTGKAGYETPDIDRRPAGPLFQKYKSRKFPGGNYMGLGNMPYAVFIAGGYAIHGTTIGNIPRLGRAASHGCIRLHPLHARIFYELVKLVGLEHTWVTVRDSIPN